MWAKKKRKYTPPPIPDQDPTSIGNLLVRSGLCTREHLDQLLKEFSRSSVEELFGQFLLAKSILTEEQLEFLLIKQLAERNGATNSQVTRAIKIAGTSQEKVSAGVDELNSVLNKVKG